MQPNRKKPAACMLELIRQNIWCFLGAIRLGGTAELERYVQSLKIGRGKKTILAGYAEPIEIEE